MARHNSKGRQRHNQVSVGVIRVARKGYGFVDTSEGEYFVLRGYLRGAMDGDKVEVVRLRALEARRRQQMRRPSAQQLRFGSGDGAHEMLGSVRRVLERAHETIVGTVRYADGLGIVRPLDEHIPYDIFLDHRAPGGKHAEDGALVVVRFTAYPSRLGAAQGYVEEVMGQEDDAGMGIEVIIREHGFETTFSAAALEEAAALTEAPVSGAAALEEAVALEEAAALASHPLPGADFCCGQEDPALLRRDLRDRFIFTIDPDDARDFDDALSVDFIDGQMRLGVHIADVSSFVAWDSALDLNARRRATSVYLPGRVIPMLPATLSEGLCSLRPGEDRLAFTVEMLINTDGSVAERSFYPSLIRSSVRLTYDEAQRILDGAAHHIPDDGALQETSGGEDPLSNRLLVLHRLARKLTRRRIRRGAIEFESAEAKLVLDEDGAPLAVRLWGKTDATSLVEEAMILANEQVAAHMLAHAAPMIYRIHDEPLAASLEDLLPIFQEFGYAREGAPQTSREIQAILEASADGPERHLISSLLLRAMKRAKYAPAYTTHFGLASPAYTHFTSPIRRYPDLLVHRLLKSQLSGEPLPSNMTEQLNWICEHSSDRERDAEQASREATAYKLCAYLALRTGERFSAIITAVNTVGLAVRESTTTAEGFIARESLPAEFEYDMKRHRYHHPDTDVVYRLGQPVSVALKEIDHIRSRLHFVLT
jgi:ribonuclease R